MAELYGVIARSFFTVTAALRSDRAHPTDAKIFRFLGYGPEPGTEVAVVAEALSWRKEMSESGFSSVEAFPGDDGEILVSGIERDFTFELIVENDRSLTVSFSNDEGSVSVEIARASRDAVMKALQEASVRLWTASGGLRVTSSTNGRIGSPGSPSGTRPELAAAYPS